MTNTSRKSVIVKYLFMVFLYTVAIVLIYYFLQPEGGTGSIVGALLFLAYGYYQSYRWLKGKLEEVDGKAE